MKTVFSILLLALAFGTSRMAAAQEDQRSSEPSAKAILKQVSERYRTLPASYFEVTTWQNGTPHHENIYCLPPGRARIEYESLGERMVVVDDGKSEWKVFAGSNEYLVYPHKETCLFSFSKLDEVPDGDLKITGRQRMDGLKCALIEVTDQGKKLVYWVEEERHLVRRVTSGTLGEPAYSNSVWSVAKLGEAGAAELFRYDPKTTNAKERATGGQPGDAISVYELGRAQAARGETEPARQQFLRAIELEPNYIQPRQALSQLQLSRREFDAALQTAGEVLKIDPGNANAQLIKSAALMGSNRPGEARTLLNAMLKKDPASVDAAFQLGTLNLSEKKYREAEDSFRRAYQLNQANPRGLLGIVEVYLAEKRPDEALKILQTESDDAPDRADLKMALANTAARLGKFDVAIEVFNGLLPKAEKGTVQADIYLRIGEAHRRQGDMSKAIQAMLKARENAPNNLTVLSELAVVLDGAQQKPEAKQVYDAVLKLDPNHAVALNNLAFLLSETGGDLDDALSKATRAKQLMPNLHEISDTLGWIYFKKSMWDNAIDVFKDLVSKEPRVSTYRFHLGMSYQGKGNKNQALEQLQEALKLNPATPERDEILRAIAALE